MINIKIPLILGGLVNIISKASVESGKSFSEQILGPGLRLVSYFVAQVGHVFFFFFGFVVFYVVPNDANQMFLIHSLSSLLCTFPSYLVLEKELLSK